MIKPSAGYQTKQRPPVYTRPQLGPRPRFEVVQGQNEDDLDRTLHIQNYSEYPIVTSFYKFTNYDMSPNEALQAAEKERDIILRESHKPIVSIEVGQGEGDCFVDCKRHGVYFYQLSSNTQQSELINHRGKQEDNEKISQLFMLQENNSGKFRYWWDQQKLTYCFERVEEVLEDGALSIEQGDNDQKFPTDVFIEFEVVSVVWKKDSGAPSTAQILPRRRVETNVYVKIPSALIFIMRLPSDYRIETKNPNTRWSLNRKPVDDYIGWGWAFCGRVIFVCKPEINSPQQLITIDVLDNNECQGIYSGNPLSNNSLVDYQPNTRAQQDQESNH